MSDRGERGGFDWEGAEDITALSEGELKESLEGLVEEEQAASYKLRVLQGRIDLIRAELLERRALIGSPEQLARALMGDRRP